MGLESWANQLTSGQQDVKVVMVADSLRDNPIIRHGDNPHIWMDPQIAQDIMHVLLNEVQQIMPDSADIFQQNAEMYIENLNRLYRDINTKLDPVKGERVIAQTPGLEYFFSAFGINQAGVIIEHAGGQPSAQHMTSLSNELSSGDILGIVHLPQFSANLPQTLSDETDVPVISMSALINGLEYVGTYLDLMWYNADQLESLLMTGV
jgi:zinc transport system substrate-binding protein